MNLQLIEGEAGVLQAVGASCDCIVTYNKQDFPGVEKFGIELVTAKELLQKIGALS